MPNEQLQFFIRNQVSRMQTEFPEINGLLGDYAVYFQWLDLGRLLASMGYPIGHLLTGERPREERSSSNYGNASSVSQAREEALRELGLDSEASQDDVKQAYRTLSKKFHPDAHATASPEILELAEEKMRKINNAYDFLTSQAN